MSNFAIYSYNGSGASMRYLCAYLDNAPIYTNNNIGVLQNKILINYGASYLRLPSWNSKWYNHPTYIPLAINKLDTFRLCRQNNVPIPKITHNKQQVREWLQQRQLVYARATATGSAGRGITLLDSPSDIIPEASFYSLSLNNDKEYRVHVVRGNVISVGLKYKKINLGSPYIRNMDNGWAFHLNVSSPECVQKVGRDAVMATKLDFGAADVAYCSNSDRAYMLEVNSAPTMAPLTASAYANAIKESSGT